MTIIEGKDNSGSGHEWPCGETGDGCEEVNMGLVRSGLVY